MALYGLKLILAVNMFFALTDRRTRGIHTLPASAGYGVTRLREIVVSDPGAVPGASTKRSPPLLTALQARAVAGIATRHDDCQDFF